MKGQTRPPCYFITISSAEDSKSCCRRRSVKNVSSPACRDRPNSPDSSRYNCIKSESDTCSDATSSITLIVLPSTIPCQEEEDDDDGENVDIINDLSKQFARIDANHVAFRRQDSFSTLSSWGSLHSDFVNVRDDTSFDQQRQAEVGCEGTRPPPSSCLDEQEQSRNPLAFEFLEDSWDDDYFTTGFVNVGQLLGAH